MIVNIVDTKGDFKKVVANDENPTTIEEAIKSIENIQHIVGKKIILILRSLRWTVNEVNNYVPMGVLDKEITEIINGETLRIEVSDM
jgi:hypothetical protein